MKKCLEEAQKKGLSTISIPAIGTGKLGFPRDRVAAASFDEVLSFSKKNPSSTLKEVHLVVYDKDLQSVQAFQSELQKRDGVGPPPLQPPAATAVPKGGKKKRRGLRCGSNKSYKTSLQRREKYVENFLVEAFSSVNHKIQYV